MTRINVAGLLERTAEESASEENSCGTPRPSSEWPNATSRKEDIIQAFYDGIKHKPETTFGNVKADVLADMDPHFVRGNFCSVIRASHWSG